MKLQSLICFLQTLTNVTQAQIHVMQMPIATTLLGLTTVLVILDTQEMEQHALVNIQLFSFEV